MMPKFRVWDKENDRMLIPGEDSDCITLEIDENGINVYDMEHPSAEKGYDLAHLDCELMQSTGLIDKNGIEIYEGDIIRHRETPNPLYNHPFKVLQARTGEWRLDNFWGGTVLAFCQPEELEIIGNIYTNTQRYWRTSDMEHNSKEYYELQSEYWFNENAKRIKERDAYKKQRDELINDMAEVKRKAEAFDEIDDLIVNGTLKDREPNAIFQNICHVIINLKERGSDE